MSLFALFNGPIGTWGFGELIVLIVCVGIVLIVLRNSGVTLPPWFWQIIGLVCLGLLALWAIKVIGGM